MVEDPPVLNFERAFHNLGPYSGQYADEYVSRAVQAATGLGWVKTPLGRETLEKAIDSYKIVDGDWLLDMRVNASFATLWGLGASKDFIPPPGLWKQLNEWKAGLENDNFDFSPLNALLLAKEALEL